MAQPVGLAVNRTALVDKLPEPDLVARFPERPFVVELRLLEPGRLNSVLF